MTDEIAASDEDEWDLYTLGVCTDNPPSDSPLDDYDTWDCQW